MAHSRSLAHCGTVLHRRKMYSAQPFFLHSSRLLICAPSPLLSAPGRVTAIKLSQRLDPVGLALTPSGHLIVSCGRTRRLWAVQPSDGECEWVAGCGATGAGDSAATKPTEQPALQAVLGSPHGLVVVERERAAFVCDPDNNVIRRVTLPDKYFKK